MVVEKLKRGSSLVGFVMILFLMERMTYLKDAGWWEILNILIESGRVYSRVSFQNSKKMDKNLLLSYVYYCY